MGDQLLPTVVCLDWIEHDSNMVRIHWTIPLCAFVIEAVRENGHTLADLRNIPRDQAFPEVSHRIRNVSSTVEEAPDTLEDLRLDVGNETDHGGNKPSSCPVDTGSIYMEAV